MNTLVLRQVQDHLYRRLKSNASSNRRSMNQEAILALAVGLPGEPPPQRPDVEASRRWLEQRSGLGELLEVDFEALGENGKFIPCLHSVGAPLAPFQGDVPWPCERDPKHKFKALAGTVKSGLVAFVSADGIHWDKLRDTPVITYTKEYAFDSQNVAYWSSLESQYVCYFRHFLDGKLRSICRTTSKDFVNWTEPRAMKPNLPGEHLYTSLAHPYFRAPHLTIATPTRFFPERGESTDILFMTARGDHPFDRTFRHAFLRPGLDPDRWGNRSNYAAWHIVPTGFTDQGPTELSLYVTPFRRFTLRLDGFASIHADADIGIATTKLFVMGGDRLEINASTSGGGRVRVELIDSSGDPIDGFRFEDCEPFVGDSIGHTVRWEKKASLASLTGIPIRARFELLEADLYAIQFATTTPSDGGPKSK
jgi:hypothetical protein